MTSPLYHAGFCFKSLSRMITVENHVKFGEIYQTLHSGCLDCMPLVLSSFGNQCLELSLASSCANHPHITMPVNHQVSLSTCILTFCILSTIIVLATLSLACLQMVSSRLDRISRLQSCLSPPSASIRHV